MVTQNACDFGTGTSGQVLTSTGAGSSPTFQALPASSSALTLIQTKSASASSAVTFTTGITTTYNNYLLIFDSALASNTGAVLQIQFSTNGGSSYINSNYNGSCTITAVGATTFTSQGSASSSLFLTGPQNTSNTNVFSAGTIYLNNLTSGASDANIYGQGIGKNGSVSWSLMNVYGFLGGTNVVNALNIFYSAGTITTGNFSLYGYSK
jgi:hypothetical protein